MPTIHDSGLHALKQVTGHADRGRIRTGAGLDLAEWRVAAAMCGESVRATVRDAHDDACEGDRGRPQSTPTGPPNEWRSPTGEARSPGSSDRSRLGSPGQRVAVLACDVETVVL
jgi:hypothetical protein